MGGGSAEQGDQEPRRRVTVRRCIRQALRYLSICCGFCLDCLDLLLRVIGPLFVILALTIIGFVTYTFFTVIVPNLSDSGTPVVLLFNEVVMACFLLVNLIYNYLMAVCTSPGQPPEYPDLESLDAELGENPRRPRQCQKCYRLKPPRTHHCSVCKRCVTKMDHHCPWINNCVGFKNYRYFCLFMLFLALSCLYVTILGFPLFMKTMNEPRRRKDGGGLNYVDMQCLSLSWLISLCIFLALCCLGGFHAYLVVTNQTTIEFHTNMGRRDLAKRKGELYRNPYDLGRSRNFQEVFGPNKFFSFIWMMPYLAKRPTGDGMSFPTVSEMMM